MKILLDENLPAKLHLGFGAEHEAKTVRGMGWSGKKNGELLGLMTLAGFEVFITLDKNLSKQQNLKKFQITIILLKARNSKHETLTRFVPDILTLLQAPLQQGLIELEK
jgi:predicted nuclease of predicted toxin-antitoxin system